MAPDQRQQVADRLNTAILTSLRQAHEPRLPALLRTVLWAQEALEDHLKCPQIASRSEITLEDPVVEAAVDQTGIADLRGLELAPSTGGGRVRQVMATTDAQAGPFPPPAAATRSGGFMPSSMSG